MTKEHKPHKQEEKTMTENRQYVENIRTELEAIYNGEAINEDGEQASFYDYFEDALDWTYAINADKSYKAVRVAVTLGGPNVYIDTLMGEIQLFWGTDEERIWLPSEICEEIDQVFEEYYNC
jgi:hypothetical protein